MKTFSSCEKLKLNNSGKQYRRDLLKNSTYIIWKKMIKKIKPDSTSAKFHQTGKDTFIVFR